MRKIGRMALISTWLIAAPLIAVADEPLLVAPANAPQSTTPLQPADSPAGPTLAPPQPTVAPPQPTLAPPQPTLAEPTLAEPTLAPPQPTRAEPTPAPGRSARAPRRPTLAPPEPRLVPVESRLVPVDSRPTPGGPTASSTVSPTGSSTEALAEALAELLVEAIPETFEEKKDWGKTRSVWSGLKFSRERPLRVSSRKRDVNHGVWKHFRGELIDPERELQVEIRNLRSDGPGFMALELDAKAQLHAWARAIVYNNGLRIMSISAEGDTRIHLKLDCRIGLQVVAESVLPRFEIDPTITSARLDLHDFHLRRISHADGPLVKELGRDLKKKLEKDLRGPKLAEKLNRAIDKKRDELILSPEKLLASKWAGLREWTGDDDSAGEGEPAGSRQPTSSRNRSGRESAE